MDPFPIEFKPVKNGGLKDWNVGGLSNLALLIIVVLLFSLIGIWIFMCVKKKNKADQNGGENPTKEIAGLVDVGFGKRSTAGDDIMVQNFDNSVKSKDSDSPKRQRTGSNRKKK